jgi:hypothetical protein
MDDSDYSYDDFTAAFEASFARFQVCVEEACAARADWPAQIAAAIRAGFEFAAADPIGASLLTKESLAAGPDGIVRHQRLLAYIAEGLADGRDEAPDGRRLPDLTERAVAGGLLTLVAERLERNRLTELPAIASQAIQFVLTPYLGAEEARRIAASS